MPLDFLQSKPGQYITLINQGGDDSFDLKQICQQWIQRETEDTKLIEFLKGIGVESMTEK